MQDNQAIPFSYAAANFSDIQLKPIPSTNQCMTKANIIEYLDVDASLLTGYANNQLVPKGKIRGAGMLPQYLEYAVAMAYAQNYPPNGNPLDGINESYKGVVELKTPIQKIADTSVTYISLSTSYLDFFRKVMSEIVSYAGTNLLQIQVTTAEYGNASLDSQQLGQLLRVLMLNNSNRASDVWTSARLDWTQYQDEGVVPMVSVGRPFYPLTLGVMVRRFNGRELGFFSMKIMPHDYFN